MTMNASVQPDADDWALARRIHGEFAAKPESQHIALAHALAYLAASVRLRRPETVLELGAGIGTITKLLLEIPGGPERIIATEDHPVCLKALDENLSAEERSRVTIVTSLDDLLALKMSFDFAICDGGFGDTRQFRGITEGAFCFFEGSRGPHRRVLNEALAERGLEFAGQNYPSPGWRIFLQQQRERKKPLWRRLKIKRRKGCWIGPVITKSADGSD